MKRGSTPASDEHTESVSSSDSDCERANSRRSTRLTNKPGRTEEVNLMSPSKRAKTELPIKSEADDSLESEPQEKKPCKPNARGTEIFACHVLLL